MLRRLQEQAGDILLLLLFDPGTQFAGNEKNYAMQYKKVQKSGWNKPYSSSFTKQSCSKMALYYCRPLLLLLFLSPPAQSRIIIVIIIPQTKKSGNGKIF